MRPQTFSILTALAASITATRHDGKAHNHPRPRQDDSTLSSIPSGNVIGVPTTTVDLNAMSSSTTNITTTEPSGPNATMSSYVFSTTVIQVPIATVCPDTPSSSAAFPIIPIPSSSINGTNSTIPPTLVNATALLPNGSTTVFLSTTTTPPSTTLDATSNPIPTATTDSDGGGATARIIFNSDGCQTVYSAKTTSICSTTIHPAGILPVTVTDCNQWVTFSSAPLDGCSASSGATDTATAMPTSDTASVGPSITGPTAFYVAHWYDLAQAPGIPAFVEVEDCLPLSTGLSCMTSMESWSVVRSTAVQTGTSLAAFSGPAIVTSGTYTATTTLSFESTMTTTSVITMSSIVRSRLADDEDDEDSTVTVAVTTPTTMTLSVESVPQTTVTVYQTSTTEVMTTMTRTGSPTSASTGS
ncbi:hypothetical protein LTR10_019540 [Elasticomyces elasticus]|uniref:Ig-like domain-containing protein n=1 Tax=Exophiala sideris TaxID=1016849 RepID=A0ABR0J518_9EURO|nr:hypothetical protein LTR10_019540 [Elasticomyces elasticus]KAK5028505.1 hypothetical protein LTS07_006596 [Exophiala sideris]KAK5035853.1 hypothetical protein LTR13_005423 [Exophiala sideris]KAK5056889.1 hypothetical protein LTR69_007527 [Exophiala sideris]KAK5181296.1 hypothetical protein LTR44_006091 [Eurotiomycetes sp. CCFEE 6388]